MFFVVGFCGKQVHFWRGAVERKNIVGLVRCVGLFVLGFFLHGNMGLYFNLAGILVVVGGTLGAATISFPLKRLQISPHAFAAKGPVGVPQEDPGELQGQR